MFWTVKNAISSFCMLDVCVKFRRCHRMSFFCNSCKTIICYSTFVAISLYFNCGIFCSLVSFHTMHLSVTIQMAVRTFIRKVWMILAKYLLCLGRVAFKSRLWLWQFRCSPGRCLLQNGSSMGRVSLFLQTRREPREG